MAIKENTFDVLLLLARPAAGKSEIIAFLKEIPVTSRRKAFHVGNFQEIDDFPMLWEWFEEDDILEKLGRERLHTDKEGYFIDASMWDLLIRKMNLLYQKRLRDFPEYHKNYTTVIEFSRGKEHGGFTRAFNHLSKDILSKAAILYIDVSYEESLRKNRKRKNPDKPDSILEHSLPDNKLEHLYKLSDWEELTAADPSCIRIQDIPVPYAVFSNEDDCTTKGGDILFKRLEESLKNLWELYRQFQVQ